MDYNAAIMVINVDHAILYEICLHTLRDTLGCAGDHTIVEGIKQLK
jgi:hypothetical protein